MRASWAWAAFGAFLLVPGCIGPAALSQEEEPTPGADHAGRSLTTTPRVGEADLPQGDVPSAAATLTTGFRGRQLDYSLTGGLGTMALRVVVDAPQDASCKATLGAATRKHDVGVAEVLAIIAAEDYITLSGGNVPGARAHVASHDTNDLAEKGGMSAGWVELEDVGGRFEMLAAAYEFASLPDQFVEANFVGGNALRMRIACNDEFEVVAVEGGRTVSILDPFSAQGGTGAHYYHWVGASVGDRHEVHVPDNQTFVQLFGVPRNGVLRMTVTDTAGTITWTESDTMARRTGVGPGTVTITVDHAGAVTAWYEVLVAGMDAGFDPARLLGDP